MVCTHNMVLYINMYISVKNTLNQITFSMGKTNDKKKDEKEKPKKTHTNSKVSSNQQIIFDEAVQLFESKCQSLSHFYCQSCQMTAINLSPSSKGNTLCTTCQASHATKESMNKELPVWHDKEGMAQYHLPDQLNRLREGEKLLIQQVAAYVTLLHLKDGQIGSKGHVCSFVQDISSICTVLPRLPDDVQFVKIVKKYLQEGGEIASKTFTIRKKKVLDALYWLKEYNVE